MVAKELIKTAVPGLGYYGYTRLHQLKIYGYVYTVHCTRHGSGRRRYQRYSIYHLTEKGRKCVQKIKGQGQVEQYKPAVLQVKPEAPGYV